MSFTEAIRTCFRKYATFSGRAPRAEYWWFQLFLILLVGGVFLLGMLLAQTGSAEGGATLVDRIAIIVVVIGFLAVILPSIAVTVRRLHDWDKSGWLYLISFIPYVGGLILLGMMLPKSSPGENRFGPHPYDGIDTTVFD